MACPPLARPMMVVCHGVVRYVVFQASATGIIVGGKRQEMVFEYTPSTVDAVEAYYRFSIPSQSITAVFVIAGVVTEPKVRVPLPCPYGIDIAGHWVPLHPSYCKRLHVATLSVTVCHVSVNHVLFRCACAAGHDGPAED